MSGLKCKRPGRLRMFLVRRRLGYRAIRAIRGDLCMVGSSLPAVPFYALPRSYLPRGALWGVWAQVTGGNRRAGLRDCPASALGGAALGAARCLHIIIGVATSRCLARGPFAGRRSPLSGGRRVAHRAAPRVMSSGGASGLLASGTEIIAAEPISLSSDADVHGED